MTRKRLLAYTAAAVSVCALVAGAFLAGGRWAHGGPLGEFTLARWNEDLEAQSEQLARIEQDVDGQVAALATRVGRMQAQLIRLDALGKQLTEVAKLKRGEFDFDQPPALGGPETAGEGPVVPALDSMLDSMDAQIDDRRRQLTALQSLIMTRELARQIVPGGRPVESGYISSLYGQRTDPFDGNQASHHGIDFAGARGHAGAGSRRRHREPHRHRRRLRATGRDHARQRLCHALRPQREAAREAGRNREARRRDRADGLDRPFDRARTCTSRCCATASR